MSSFRLFHVRRKERGSLNVHIAGNPRGWNLYAKNRFSNALMEFHFLWFPDSAMASRRDLPFPLVIVCLVLIRGCSPLPTVSEVTGTNPTTPSGPRVFRTLALPPDNYYDDDDDDDGSVTPVLPKSVPPVGGTPERCKYNPCLESQTSCADLATSTGCLCPGFTLHDVIPDAPNLKSVSWNGSEVVIQWCAPYSYVTAFVVTVGGQEKQKFGKNRRSGGVGDIDHISEVCVIAVNDAGESDGSCKMYQPRDNSLLLKAGLIGGALGFLLLLLLAVLLWRHKKQRKQEASISMQDTAETQWAENRARLVAEWDKTPSHETPQPHCS